MNYDKKTSTLVSAIWHINRIILGSVFIFSGFVKAIDPIGTQYKIEDYLQAFGSFFTIFSPLALFMAFMLIATECTLGVCLLTNVLPKITSWLTVLFYAVMTPLTLYIALANPVSDCGCFGDAIKLTNWQTFCKNLVLIALAIVSLVVVKHIHSQWNIRTSLVTIGGSYLLLFGFMFWTLRHLPIIDFRPFKIGNNIPALMEYPDDAEPDQYDITFIYEKDGKRKKFSLDDYPKDDSTWHFVDQQSTLIKKGYEPPIHDFELVNLNYEDLTYHILDSGLPTTLVIMYSLEKCDRKQMQKVNTLFRQSTQNKQPFYIVTGANQTQIEAFCAEMEKGNTSNELTPFNHPEAVFLMCDPITLKTVVRANPGVIIVKNGIVIEKFNLNNR